MVAEWGSIFILTAKQQFIQLSEKDLPAKMDALFAKNLYNIAISLALSQVCMLTARLPKRDGAHACRAARAAELR